MAATLRRSLLLSTLLSIGSLTESARLNGGGGSLYSAPPVGLHSPPVGSGGGNGYPSGSPFASGNPLAGGSPPASGFPLFDSGFGSGAPGSNGGGGGGGSPTPPIPDTSFSCEEQDYPGYYADIEANCEIFHICQEDGRHDSFLCPNTTLFNQQYLVCDWPTNVDCAASADFFSVNAEIGKVPEGGSGGGGANGNFGPSSDVGFGGGVAGGYGGGSNGGGQAGPFANPPSSAYGPPGK